MQKEKNSTTYVINIELDLTFITVLQSSHFTLSSFLFLIGMRTFTLLVERYLWTSLLITFSPLSWSIPPVSALCWSNPPIPPSADQSLCSAPFADPTLLSPPFAVQSLLSPPFAAPSLLSPPFAAPTLPSSLYAGVADSLHSLATEAEWLQKAPSTQLDH